MTGFPELGPWLGRLTAARAPGAALPGLDEIRLALVGELFEAAARVRAAEVRGEPETGPILDAAAWLGFYRSAARQAAALVTEEVHRRIAAAAMISRIPHRQLARRLPDAEDVAIVGHRAEAAGIPLERLVGASSTNDQAGQAQRAAAALQEAWDRLEVAMSEELGRWTAVARGIESWRRDPRPLWVATVLAVAFAIWLGLSIGGYLPAPGLIGSVRDWWWSLPWP